MPDLREKILLIFIILSFSFSSFGKTEKKIIEQTNNFGLLLSYPCKTKNFFVQIIFKNLNKEEFVLKNILIKKENCKEKQLIPVEFNLAVGNWKLFSIAEVKIKGKKLKINNQFIVNNSKFLKNTNPIKKQIQFNKSEIYPKNVILYLGNFIINDINKNEIVLNRSLIYRQVRKKFKNKKIWNAFDDSKISEDRVLGNITLYIKSNKNIDKSTMKELEIFSTENLMVCVQNEEKINPLLYLAGSINFSEKTNEFTYHFSEGTNLSSELRNCFNKSIENMLDVDLVKNTEIYFVLKSI